MLTYIRSSSVDFFLSSSLFFQTERIAAQKFAVRVLVTLYRHSSDIPGRSDTLKDGPVENKRATMNPRKILKKALKGVKRAATTTTTATITTTTSATTTITTSTAPHHLQFILLLT